MDTPREQWDDWRQHIIGLGDRSSRKNYYPELRRSLEELRASEADLRTVFDSVTDAIFIHDDQGRVEEVNQAMVRMFGVSREQATRFSVLDYSAPGPQRARLAEAFGRLNQGEEHLFFEWKARRPLEDTVFDVEVGLRATRWRNRAMIVAVVRDITERKQAEQRQRALEEQLAQARKMESIGRLAGGVAHDFNNMLQAILGHAELALAELAPESPARENLAEIRDCARRSAELTRQLLGFARRQTVAPRVLDLNDVVVGMLKMLRRLIGENISLAWLPGACLWSVRIDPSQIDQILANLCVNARDAIAGTGHVTLQTENRTLGESDAPGDYVLLSVSDDGCGMAPETRSHLFEPFFTTKDVGKGTGLGLATTYGIVQQNHGFIEVASEPGKGSTFRIFLPRHRAPVEACPAAPAAGSGAGGRETVLLVEDEPAILKVTKSYLEPLGYAVLAANTPGEALRLGREYSGRIDLLVTDVVMPEMNGRDLAERLSVDHPHVKRLYMSGHTSDVIAHQGVLNEGVRFIQKPFALADLAARIREALERA